MAKNPNTLEAQVAQGLPSGYWLCIDQLPVYHQIINGKFKMGDVDFIVWDTQTSAIVLIECKRFYNVREKKYNTISEGLILDSLVPKLFSAFCLVHNHKQQSNLWCKELRSACTTQPLQDSGWGWKLVFVADVDASQVFALSAYLDKLKEYGRKLVEYTGMPDYFNNELDRVLLLTVQDASRYFPHLFPAQP